MDFGKCATAAQESKRTTAGTRPAENRHHASWGCLGRRQELQDPTWRGQKGWDRPLDNNFQDRPNHRHAPLQCSLFSDPVGQTAQRGAGAPLGMRPWSGMQASERGLLRRPSLPDPPCGGPAGCGSGRHYDAEEPGAASAAFRANPEGRGFRAPGIVARLADIPDIGCASLRAMHHGKAPSRPSSTYSEVP